MSFSNLYLTNKPKNFPTTYFANSLIEVYGLIKTNNPTCFWLAKKVAGPDPIDLPKIIMLSGFIYFYIKCV